MSFKAAKCPNCAGDIQVPEERDTAKCMYCGSDIVVREAIKLAASEINLDNIFRLADEAVNSNNYSEAYNYYTKILEREPDNYKAWYGKAISAGWQSTLNDLRLLETITGIENAIKYVPDNEKNELKIKAALSMNQIAVAVYNLAYKNFTTYITVDTYNEFISRVDFLVSFLEKASIYKPDDKQILENIIVFIQTYMKEHTNKITYIATFLLDSAYIDAKNKIQEVTKKIQQLDPSYNAEVPPQKGKYGACFIATATYGSPMASEVILFRQFRDNYIALRPFGKVFIKAYYKISPPIANAISRSEILKWITRQILKPIIIMLKNKHWK